MVWFKVDDKMHSHPKTANVSLAAIGLWTVAGSWCGQHTTDGRVPGAVVRSLSRGAPELAEELVSAGLWVPSRDGFRFHQWLADSDGTKRNPSKKEVAEMRAKKADAGRKGGLASGKARSASKAGASGGAQARRSSVVEPPNPSLPLQGRVGGSAPASPGRARSPAAHLRPGADAATVGPQTATTATGEAAGTSTTGTSKALTSGDAAGTSAGATSTNGSSMARDQAIAAARSAVTAARAAARPLHSPFLPPDGGNKPEAALAALDAALNPPPREQPTS